MGRLGVLGGCWIVLFVLLSAPQNAAAESFVRGDVNSDSRVSIGDLAFLIHSQLLEGREPDCEDAADVDDNGELTFVDTLYLLVTLFGEGATAIPAPYPDAGEDPTDDSLDACVAPGEGAPGVDIDHVFYLALEGFGAPSLAAKPGHKQLEVPIFMDTNVALTAYTITLSFDPEQILDARFVFDRTVGEAHGADWMMGITKDPDGDRKHILGYVLVLFNLDDDEEELTVPAGEEQVVARLVLDLADDLEPGDEVVLEFEALPGDDVVPEAPNEVVLAGLRSSFPRTSDIVIPIVDGNELFLRGDASDDGRLSFTDAFTLLRYLFQEDSDPLECPDAGDLDDSGTLTFPDALLLLRYLFLDGTKLPNGPFPWPGVDLTEDELPCREEA